MSFGTANSIDVYLPPHEIARSHAGLEDVWQLNPGVGGCHLPQNDGDNERRHGFRYLGNFSIGYMWDPRRRPKWFLERIITTTRIRKQGCTLIITSHKHKQRKTPKKQSTGKVESS
ncbi:hypothetical protein SAY87_003114 [Trapa incisa]|uniref:Uncharacterized protein n=1 Tax=Trapa incisa TaxID=236973 RepID=A0AAN7QIP7_9MYRT|nr:hypothetical protein SAY87_003114 [Trapa incisa]